MQVKFFLQVRAAANCNSEIRKVCQGVLSSAQVYHDEDLKVWMMAEQKIDHNP